MSAPIDTDRMVSRCQDWGNDDAEEAAREMCDEIDRLRAELQEARREGYRLTSLDLESCITEVDRLRDLLRQALPWIDPNDRHEDWLLTVAIREALGEPT